MAYSYVRYTGNGSTTNYTFAFSYISPDTVKVRLDDVLTTEFTFLNANTITLNTAPDAGVVIEIRRETPKFEPIVNFSDGSVLLERDLDLLAQFDLQIAQESADAVEETISADASGRWDAQLKRMHNLAAPLEDDEAVTKGYLDYEYPAVSTVAASVANVNIVGSDLGAISSQPQDLGLITDTLTTTSPSATSKITIVATNIDDVNTVAANITAIQDVIPNVAAAAASATAAAGSATAASGSASAASTSASGASTSATSAAASASSSATSATASAGSATTATTQATNAASSATAAAGSATSASGSAATATTKASEASASASAAATSESNAAASAASSAALLDNFDDRYLGSKTSAPTLDNDGNALAVGSLYFNTTTSNMQVYTSSGWIEAVSITTIDGAILLSGTVTPDKLSPTFDLGVL